MAPKLLKALPLTPAAFRPFGDVIEEDGHAPCPINGGGTLRFNNLAKPQAAGSGRLSVNLFRALNAMTLPYHVRLLECHPLGSQAFIPCEGSRFLIVVAEPGATPDGIAAFITNGRQGVNYRRGVWHAPLVSFAAASYVVVDRVGLGENLIEYEVTPDGIDIVD